MTYIYYFLISWILIGFLSIIRISYWFIICKLYKKETSKINDVLKNFSIRDRILATIGIILLGPISFHFIEKTHSNQDE